MEYYTHVAKYGNKILLRGRSDDGARFLRKVDFRPTLYLPSKDPNALFKTLDGKPVEPFHPGSISDCRDWVNNHKDVTGFQFYGNTRWEYAFIADQYPDHVDWDYNHLRTFVIDIEVSSENGFPEPDVATEEIIAITIKNGDEYYVFGTKPYKPKNSNVIYYSCRDERDLIKKFLHVWTSDYPDIVTGWHIAGFDIPYLVNRISKLFGEVVARTLSPWKIINSRKFLMMGRERTVYDLVGVSSLDYMDIYRKFSDKGASQESYKLDYIAQQELGEQKLDYSEYNNLYDLYLKNFEKFIDYNIHDTTLVSKLDAKMKLLELVLTLAYNAKANYIDVFHQTRLWDSIIFNYLLNKNIVVPQKEEVEKDSAYSGAYVKDPQPGMYRWIASLDLTSLYPHIQMMYNLSPETLIEPENYDDEMVDFLAKNTINIQNLLEKKIDTSILKKKNITLTPNGQFFRKDIDGFMPTILKTMYADRAKHKKLMIAAKKRLEVEPENAEELGKIISKENNMQGSLKVSLNSCYGATGNEYFRFFDVRIAEGITMSAQLSTRWIEEKINSYMRKILKTNHDYVIASDTDSIYLNMEEMIEKFLPNEKDVKKKIDFMDKVCSEKLQPFIDMAYNELAEYINAHSQSMSMKREALCDRALWTAKKRYVLNVYDQEGVRYHKPELKIVGLEAIRSSTPSSCRLKIKETINKIFQGTESEVQDFIEKYREEFKTLPIEDISFPRGVNDLEEYYDPNSIFKKGTPIQVRGSLVFNHYLAKMNLTKKYPTIKSGEKIKFIYLREPNPFMSNAIAYSGTVPKEFDLRRYIDYNTQFEKAYLEPIKNILNIIGWRAEATNTLEDLFV